MGKKLVGQWDSETRLCELEHYALLRAGRRNRREKNGGTVGHLPCGSRILRKSLGTVEPFLLRELYAVWGKT